MKVRVFAILAVSGLLFPSASAAKTFELDVCHTPGGKEVGTSGWVALNPTDDFYYDPLCNDQSFGLSTKPSGGPYPPGLFSGWRYSVNGGLAVVGYAGVWSVGASMSSAWGWHGGVLGRKKTQPNWIHLSVCNMPGCGQTGWMNEIPPLDEVAVGIQCTESGGNCPSGSSASIDVQWLRLRIDDPYVPTLSATGGSLTSPAPLAGSADVAYRATDQGGGIASVSAEVDGRTMSQRSYLNPLSTCRTPTVVQHPCPASATGQLTVDTTTLADGVHAVRLVTRDLAGNVASTPSSPITVANRRIVNLCSSQLGPEAVTRLRPGRLVFGRAGLLSVKWSTITWEAAEAVLMEGQDVATLGNRAVQRGARFLVDVPPGVTRIVRMGFRQAGSTGPYICTKPLLVVVHARVSLRARPRRLMNGGRVLLRGAVGAGAVANARSVVIEAKAKGAHRRWTPVKVVRTNRSGRFHFAYRFVRTTVRARFLFRARLLVERDFPYAAGVSKPRMVTVVPRSH